MSQTLLAADWENVLVHEVIVKAFLIFIVIEL
jgi:hypothetical protein